MTDEDFKWIKNPPHTFIARIYFDPKNNNFFMKEPLEERESKEHQKHKIYEKIYKNFKTF